MTEHTRPVKKKSKTKSDIRWRKTSMEIHRRRIVSVPSDLDIWVSLIFVCSPLRKVILLRMKFLPPPPISTLPPLQQLHTSFNYYLFPQSMWASESEWVSICYQLHHHGDKQKIRKSGHHGGAWSWWGGKRIIRSNSLFFLFAKLFILTIWIVALEAFSPDRDELHNLCNVGRIVDSAISCTGGKIWRAIYREDVDHWWGCFASTGSQSKVKFGLFCELLVRWRQWEYVLWYLHEFFSHRKENFYSFAKQKSRGKSMTLLYVCSPRHVQ